MKHPVTKLIDALNLLVSAGKRQEAKAVELRFIAWWKAVQP